MITVVRVVVLSVVLLLSWVSPSPAGAASWESNGAGWTGSGAAFLPDGTFIGDPQAPSDCPGCVWRVDPVCELTGENNCQQSYGCPAGQPFALIRVTTPTIGFPATVGSQCIAPGEPVSVEELGRRVWQQVNESAPAIRLGFQPTSGAITSLPTIFWAGQAPTLERSQSIAGLATRLSARARWMWHWGDGRRSGPMSVPGAPWPSQSVTHVYRQPGVARVQLTTTWDAQFWVQGVGPFAIADPVTQFASTSVRVREARAELVDSLAK